MYQLPGKVGQHLRDDDWLMTVKQRAAIPGGMCEFDLPSYHYWLHQSADVRMSQLQHWLAPFSSIRSAVGIVLGLLRDSGHAELQHAKNGSYQRMLESRNPQLIRVTLGDELPCVPEISANKYMLNIRFVHAGSGAMRTCTDQPIDFDLTFCNL
jgi:cell division protein ZapD